MTRYYLYIEAGLELDHSTRFYCVGIGECAQGRKHHAWLEAYAAEHGHFFVRWTLEAADFYTKCADSIGHDAAPLVHRKAAQVIEHLKNGCEDPAYWQAIQHRNDLLEKIDPRFYACTMLNKKR